MSRATSCLLFVCLFAAGCGKPANPNDKPVFPVTGTVMVDGQPADGLRIDLHDVSIEPNPNNPIANFTSSSAMTDKDGKFQVSTYNYGDGAPDGEYELTFLWGRINPHSMQYGGPDKLKGKFDARGEYSERLTVAGQAVDLGVIELSTK